MQQANSGIQVHMDSGLCTQDGRRNDAAKSVGKKLFQEAAARRGDIFAALN
jgi:hypothetical protein